MSMIEEFANRYKYYEEIKLIVEYLKPIKKLEFMQSDIYQSIDASRWMIYAPDLILAYSDNSDVWAEQTTLESVAENSENDLNTFLSILAFSVMESDILQEIERAATKPL